MNKLRSTSNPQSLGLYPKTGYILRIKNGPLLDSFPKDEDLFIVCSQAQFLADDYESPIVIVRNGRFIGVVYPNFEDGLKHE